MQLDKKPNLAYASTICRYNLVIFDENVQEKENGYQKVSGTTEINLYFKILANTVLQDKHWG